MSEQEVKSVESTTESKSPSPGKVYGGRKFETGDQAYARLLPIVNGISYKYAATNPFIDQDDLASDLWFKLMKVANDSLAYVDDPQDYENPLSCLSSSYAATICHRYAADRYRYHRLRRDSTQQLILEMEGDEPDEDDGTVITDLRSITNEADGVAFTDMLHRIIDNCTEPGTKARKWLISKLYYENLLTDETLRETDRADLMVVDDPFTESGFVFALGYKSPRPGSWGATLWNLRQSICKYLWSSTFTDGMRWDNFPKNFECLG